MRSKRMCIICNCGETGDKFLSSFVNVRQAMQIAAEDMLACKVVATTPEAIHRYDRTHKKIVRMMREWNRIEGERENDDA